MAKIRYSPEALQDLINIGDYISETLRSPMAALNTVNKIQDKVDNLADFPLIGTPLSPPAGEKTDYRYLVCGNYLAFHHVKDEIVLIDRILYGRRDYMTIIFGRELKNDGGLGEAQDAVSDSAYSEEEILGDVMRLRYGNKKTKETD